MKKHFKKTLTIDGNEHEFHFKLVRHDDDSAREISVTEGQYTFPMVKESESVWKIVGANLPEYIRHAELELNEAILDNESPDHGPSTPNNSWNILGG